MSLRADVGRADFALHLQAVDIELETATDAFARIDRASDRPPRCCQEPLHCRLHFGDALDVAHFDEDGAACFVEATDRQKER